jgi:glycosyltransferase involved in cell wall biosynthesis
MRIGIVPTLNPSSGGTYQYSLTMMRVLDELKRSGWGDEVVVFVADVHHPTITALGSGWAVRPLCPPRPKLLDLLGRIVGEGPHREAWRWLRRQLQEKAQRRSLPNPDLVRFQSEISDWFRGLGIELMLYPTPNVLSFETKIPYVMAIHDLQHRLHPEFPEVSAKGELERREYMFRNGCRYATLLLADSEAGREDILKFYGTYGVTQDRVKILPFLLPCYLAVNVSEKERERVRTIYDLPERYLFYPAQFWPHKNHARIVQALSSLKQAYHLEIPMVFCGSQTNGIREETLREVISLSHRLGLKNQVCYLDYVPDEDMSGLYAEATALVMPTFFGPTNIPVLEAWAFGCPVITSDIHGIREQVADAAILVDPHSVESIADAIYRVWTDGSLRRDLADRGRQRLASYTPEDYRKRLRGILEEARARRRVRSENRGATQNLSQEAS